MSAHKITIQPTNNENILKFVSNQILINGGSYEFNNIDEAKNSPLAQQLFYLPFVKKIFITANFIAIQRYNIVEWIDVQEEVKEQIEAYFVSGGIAVKENSESRKKAAIEVYAQATPNPSTMKFGTNSSLTTLDVEYKNIEEASKSSPLAKALFGFQFVKEVFISGNYIAIAKFDIVEWDDVAQEVRVFITEFMQDGGVVVHEEQLIRSQEEKTELGSGPILNPKNLGEVEARIVDILEEYIKPAVAQDGGNIAFMAYKEKIVEVQLQGACSGCPSSTMTLKNGILSILQKMLPTLVDDVVAINE